MKTAISHLAPQPTTAPPWGRFPAAAKVLLAMAAIGILLLGFLFYRIQKNQLLLNAEDEVWAVATEKGKLIENWRAERLGDAGLITHSPLVEHNLARWLRKPDPAAAEPILVHFRLLQQCYHYSDVLAVDAGGHILLSLSGRKGALTDQTSGLLRDSLRTHEPAVSDLQKINAQGPAFLEVIAPVKAEMQPPAGAVILVTDPFPLLHEWPLPRRTTETLLIRREGDHFLVLNEPRGRSPGAFRLKIPVAAVAGASPPVRQSGKRVFEGSDYTGARVLSAVIPVKNSPWLLLVKIDLAEALAPLRYYRWVVIALVLGLLSALAAGIAVLNQRMQREHFRAAYQSEQALRVGESKYKAIVQAIPDVMFRLSAEGVCLDFHVPRFYKLAVDPEKLPGKPVEEIFPAEIAAEFRRYMAKAHETGVVQVFRFQLDLAEERRYYEARLIACEDETLTIARNITEAKQNEDEIKRLLSQVREDAAVLEKRVAERTAQLSEANAELEAFAYSVSHDLKAPLRGINGYGRLLEEDHADRLDAEGRLFIGYIRSGAAQMNELIEDLLKYSRMERRALQSVSVDLPALVQGVVAECAAEIARLGVELRLEVPPLAVRADYEGLAIVLRNLLDNAVKFSSAAKPPKIEIGARAEGRTATLWVRDNGVGFDMKFHDRIFEIFQRLHRAEEYPGTGIGLALVRKAMTRMGGRAWAESAPGEGATFYLEIPT